jgi:oligoribonuclease NrnB/cAMP/cGMP phosphodiesterase (DHH superfamily)
MDNCFHIFNHKDLDGVLSLLVFKWFYPEATITYKAVTNLNVEVQIEEHLKNIINPHNIYVLDLALRESFKPFDLPFVTFIDHHKRSNEFKDIFTNSKVLLKEYSSNVKLTYKILEKIKSITLTNEQKKLILLGDDFDSGENKFEESYDLNILFWAFYKNNIGNFLKTYNNGFFGISEKEKKIILECKAQAIGFLRELPIFKGSINIEGQNKTVICSHGETINTLTLDYMLKKYETDLLFFINTKTEKVNLKQKKSENNIDLAKFATKYCNGNGHNLSAGGNMTDIFMELTKNFKAI